MVPEWLLPEESKAVVPEPSSKVQRAIASFVTCPWADGLERSGQIDADATARRLTTRRKWIVQARFGCLAGSELGAHCDTAFKAIHN